MRQIFISVAKIMHLFLNNAAMRLSYDNFLAFLFYCPVGDSSSLHIEIDAHLHRG